MPLTVADLGTLLIVAFGLLDLILAALLVWRPRLPLSRLEYALIALVCLLPAVLWGGQALGWFKIGPEWGRASFALALAAVSWLLLAALRWRVRA